MQTSTSSKSVLVPDGKMMLSTFGLQPFNFYKHILAKSNKKRDDLKRQQKIFRTSTLMNLLYNE